MDGVYHYKKGYRYFVVSMTIVIAAIIIWQIVDFPGKAPFRSSVVLTLLTIMIIAIVVWYRRFELVVSDSYIERHGFGTRRVDYEDIEEMRVWPDWALIKTADGDVKITKEIESNKDIIRYVMSRYKLVDGAVIKEFQ